MIELLYALILIAVTGGFLGYRFKLGLRRLYLSDAFVLGTASHALGSWILLAESETVASLFISSAALACFAVTVLSVMLFKRKAGDEERNSLKSYSSNRIYFKSSLFLVIAINAFILYVILSNPGLSKLIFATITSADEGALLRVRKAITASTEGYMSPGLIKLGRDIISPILIGGFIVRFKYAKRSALLWVAVAITLLAMLVGGQRFPVLLLLITIFACSRARLAIDENVMHLSPRKFVAIGVACLIAFYFLSSSLGRVGNNDGGFNAILWSINSLVDRTLTTVPRESVKTYYFWSEIGPTQGVSWLRDIAVLIPGQDLAFSNSLHQLAGGSAQGNAPLFYALDAWLAFGWPGVLIAPIFFVVLLNSIDGSLRRYRSPLTDASHIVMFVNVPLMYSPSLFLLYGGIVIIPLCLWSMTIKKNKSQFASHNRKNFYNIANK